MLKTLKAVLKDESGVTMIEYGLLAALIAVIVALALGPLNAALTATFGTVTAAL